MTRDASAEDDEALGMAAGSRSRERLSATFFAMNSLAFRSVMTIPHRSSTPFSLLRSMSRSLVPEFVPVGITASRTESWITRDYALSALSQAGVPKARTSRFEKRSLSTKSATPSSRRLLSAKAMPTALTFVDAPAGALASLTAMTMGEVKRSEFENRMSSTAWRFPGDAYNAVSQTSLKSFKDAPPYPT